MVLGCDVSRFSAYLIGGHRLVGQDYEVLAFGATANLDPALKSLLLPHID